MNGKWQLKGLEVRCSACGAEAPTDADDDYLSPDICPGCGAHMTCEYRGFEEKMRNAKPSTWLTDGLSEWSVNWAVFKGKFLAKLWRLFH